ncbi:MAG: IPT/TIG domain-containing protein [Spirochaetaceae bacterium]|nr:IPT/TIG domain-containing protein [Spirochaetaceae bacterium]
MEPRIGSAGEILTISGTGFGEERGGSYITIAGTPPTIASYLSWQNDQIRIRTPEFSGTGLLYVHRDGKKSNPLLLTNRVSIPRFTQNNGRSLGPIITGVKPASGPIGSLVTIEGSGFGSSRETGGVFFTRPGEPPAGLLSGEGQSLRVEVSASDFGYELWTDREIQVRVPDGASSGVLEVRTPRKTSGSLAFTVTDNFGAKTFKEKRNYTISYSVDIHVQAAKSPNVLYLWVPQPGDSASQRIAAAPVFSREPFIYPYQGTALFQLSDLKSEENLRVSISYAVDVYAVESNFKNPPLKSEGTSPIQAVHTLPSPLIPSEAPEVTALAKALSGNEQNSYEKVRKLYEWLIKEVRYTQFRGGPLEVLPEKQGDAYSTALLFCALARAVDVPAIPLAGVLVTKSRQAVRHYWAEFWVDGVGWAPVDPALGAGASPEDFALPRDPATYYFGNADNQRIVFSRGPGMLSQMDPYGRTVVRPRDYALQNLWEEAAGGLEAYSSLWSDIVITGVYSQ